MLFLEKLGIRAVWRNVEGRQEGKAISELLSSQEIFPGARRVVTVCYAIEGIQIEFNPYRLVGYWCAVPDRRINAFK